MKGDLKEYSSLTMDEVWELYSPYLRLIEEEIKESLTSIAPLTNEIAVYMLNSGGKRIRPLLMIISSKLCGHAGNDDVILAGTVESIHTATLLHDDVIDNAEIRRGRRAVRTLWGNQTSILVGDFFYTRAICKAVGLRNHEINEILSDTCKKLTEGEILQLSYNGDLDLREEEYLEIVKYKTATLISTACKLGGIITNVSLEEKSALAEFGLKLGIAFQVADDTLDYIAKKERLGKSLGNDLRDGKITLPLLHLLRYSEDKEKKKVKDIVRNKGGTREDMIYILELMNRYGSIEYAFDVARSFSEKAKENIVIFNSSLHKSALLTVADYIVSRDH